MRFLLLIIIALVPSTLWAQAPSITSFNPTHAASGATVTITGTGFTDATEVSFGGTNAASFTIDSDNQISAVVDNGTSGDVSVTSPLGTGLMAGFTFIAAPTISSFTPTNASSGTTVTIIGTGFTDATEVSFGGTNAASFTIDSDNQISAVVDNGASGDVSVTTSGGTGLLAGFTYDNVSPTVIITSAVTDPTNVTPFSVTITFSEDVTDFIESDIIVTNGTINDFTGSGTIYTLNITPIASGFVTVSVAANVAMDAAANGNTVSNTLSRNFDNTNPSVVISSTAANPTNVSPFPITITFSESVTGFVLSDITVTNATINNFAGSGTTYTANISPTAAGVVTISVAANVAADAATNGNTVSNTLSRTFDNTNPSVVISSTATDPTNVSPIPVTITFSESVTGFILSDITVTNATINNFAGSGTTYTANITPTAAGVVTISVAANVAADAATNGNTISNTLSRTYDNINPSVVISSTAANPTNVSPFPITIAFSESVTGFVLSDITVTNATITNFAGSGTTYTANITPTAAGVVTISVAANVAADAATNGNTISNTLSRTYDNINPSVVISSTAANPTNVSPFPITIAFSESVTGFVLSDITVTNATITNFAGSGTTYTANITPTAAGVVTISVAANVAADAATNGNTVSNTLSRNFDNTNPSVVISSTAANPTNVSPFPITITFSESVTGFVLSDITVTNATITNFAGSGTTYTANISPTAAGLITVSISANVAVDAAGNGNIGSIAGFTFNPIVINSFTPASGAIGTSVIITGLNFGASPVVTFNGKNAIVSSSTSTSITVTVPSDVASGLITVTSGGVTVSSNSDFIVLPTPSITGFSPAESAVGGVVTITGLNLDESPTVSFNGVSASVLSATSSSVTVTVPSGATTGKISLRSSGVTVSSSTNFTILPAPAISDFTPDSGLEGAPVTINGSNFGTSPAVSFNGTAAVVSASTSNSIVVTVPYGATTGTIGITSNGVTVFSSSPFTILYRPIISSFSPTSGFEGSDVTITGLHFSDVTLDNTIEFNGTMASVISSTTTSINTKVPAGATSGYITVTVNGLTGTSDTNFNVLVDTTAPELVINNTPSLVNQESPLLISAQFIDMESTITSAAVIYRATASGADPTTTPLVKSGDNWTFIIPTSEIDELGIEYKLQATNSAGLTFIHPSFLHVSVIVAGDGLSIPYNSFGNSIANYQMFSIPLELDMASVKDIFDELPYYDKSKWRISHYDNATNANMELSPSDVMEPGAGYWLIIKDNPGKAINTGSGKSVSELPFTIPLKAGWNQIGNPYHFNLNWSDLAAVNPGLPVSFRSYNGSIKNFENKTTLHAMEGGFVNVAADMPLVFPVKKNTGGRVSSQQSITGTISDENWELDFTIIQNDISNVIGGLGMRQYASNEFDIYDGFSMPRFGEYLELNHNKKLNRYSFSKDVVPNSENHVWNFVVDASDQQNQAVITWNSELLSNLSSHVILVDEKTNVWVNMKQHQRYTFVPPARFNVIYGDDSFLTKEIGAGKAKIIDVFPNPSTGPVGIHIFVPEWQTKATVQLELKSLTGVNLETIFNGQLNSGYQTIEWRKETTPLPNGVYFLQLKCNDSVQVMRVIFMK